MICNSRITCKKAHFVVIYLNPSLRKYAKCTHIVMSYTARGINTLSSISCLCNFSSLNTVKRIKSDIILLQWSDESDIKISIYEDRQTISMEE